MSETTGTDDQAPAQNPNTPHVMVVPSPQGGHLGVMQLGAMVRAFAGDTLERIQALITKVAIGEFGLSQGEADSLAASAPLTPNAAAETDVATLQAKVVALTQQAQALEAENARLSSMVSLAGSNPSPVPVPSNPDAWRAVSQAWLAGAGAQPPHSGVPSSVEAWSSIGAAYGQMTDPGPAQEA